MGTSKYDAGIKLRKQILQLNPNFDLSKYKYNGAKTHVTIICHEKDSNGIEHGEFTVRPCYVKTFNKCNCPKCNRHAIGSKTYDKQALIDEVTERFGDLISFEKTVYVNQRTPTIFTCKYHGDFEMLPMQITRSKYGCPYCAGRRITTEIFIERAQKIHQIDGKPKYDYSKTKYIDSDHKVIIICPEHGEFQQDPSSHLQGAGCPYCAGKRINTELFIKKAQQIHQIDGKPKYDYSKTIYTGAKDKVTIICPKHGEFQQLSQNHIDHGQGCPECAKEFLSGRQTSYSEKELFEFINDCIGTKYNIKTNIRTILPDNNELDIYIPELHLAIEFDGIYWHTLKPKDYHLNKTNQCEKLGIHLIHIFENEWRDHQEIVKSRLRQLLGITKYKIQARKCKIKLIEDTSIERSFLTYNHLQGYVSSKVCYGLYYFEPVKQKEYLVALMSFGKLRKSLGSKSVNNEWELYRFCNLKNFTVIGGASKLFKYFISQHNPEKIISFANRRYSTLLNNNTLYNKLGFEFDSCTVPNYYYINGQHIINRFNLRKDILVSKYNCPQNITEKEFVIQTLGYKQLYDCGNLKFIWTK